MATQKNRQEIIDALSKCGTLSYQDMVNLLYSIAFLNEIDAGSFDGFISRFTGEWTTINAQRGKYDNDYYAVKDSVIYKSTVNNNISTPGSSQTWIPISSQGTSLSQFNPTQVPNGGTLPSTTTPIWMFLSPGTYTKPEGGTLTVSGQINIVATNGSSYRTLIETSINLSAYVLKEESPFGRYGPYATVAAANLAVPNTVVGGKNQRDGKFVLIGTTSSYSVFWWKGGFADINLVPLIDDRLTQIANNYPTSSIAQAVPASQAGYYRVDSTGSFSAGGTTYLSYTLNVADYTFPLYVSGQMKDAGTALAFYYNAAGALLGYEFQGTTSVVTYTKQKLNPPAGTTKINITVLAAGGAVKIYSLVPATNVLTKEAADLLYATNADLGTKYIPISMAPALPGTGEVIFNNIDFATATSSGGDTGTVYYISKNAKPSKSGTILKRITIKVNGDTSLKIAVFSITKDTSGTIKYTRIYDYAPIPVLSGTAEYTISDNFVLPLNCYVGVSYSTAAGFYYNGQSGVGSYRLSSSGMNESTVVVAYNFVTSDSNPDLTGALITQEFADGRYVKNSTTTYKGLTIINRKQIKIPLLSTDKILLYGDSISSQDYPWYKDSMQALTGAAVYNGGFSGMSAGQLAQNAQLQRMWDYGAKVNIVMVGGNDTGTFVGTFGEIPGENIVSETDISVDYNGTYFIQAISHIIRKHKDRFDNIRQRAALTGTETEADKTTKIDAVLKPYLVFCTTLPQKRNNSSDSFSNPANWQRKRDAVIECCNKYNVHCIDLCNLPGWDMSIEPYWVSPTNKVTNNGVYFMDGLHPNKYGFDLISKIVCGQIGII